MDNNKLVVYQWLSAVLVFILLMIGVLWYFSGNDYEAATDNFKTDLITYRQQIDEKCKTTATSSAVSDRDCNEILDDLTAVLMRYRTVLDAQSTSTEDLPLTTPTSTATTTATTSVI